MSKIDSLLNSFEASEVFRQHHITARGMDGVREGFNTKGAHFMTDLIKAVSPGSVLNGNYGGLTDEEYVDDIPFNTAEIASNATGKGWAFWEKALGLIGKTGETVKEFKLDILGTPTAVDPAIQASAKRNNTIIYVIAIVILGVVGYFLFKNK